MESVALTGYDCSGGDKVAVDVAVLVVYAGLGGCQRTVNPQSFIDDGVKVWEMSSCDRFGGRRGSEICISQLFPQFLLDPLIFGPRECPDEERQRICRGIDSGEKMVRAFRRNVEIVQPKLHEPTNNRIVFDLILLEPII